MAFNKRNYLLRIIDIQNVTLEYKKKGVKQKWIFENLIEPNYHISLSTYNSYLSVNAKRMIKELNDKKQTVI